MKHLMRLKSEEGLPSVLSKLPKPISITRPAVNLQEAFDSFDSTEGRHYPEKVVPIEHLSKLFTPHLGKGRLAGWGEVTTLQVREAEERIQSAWRQKRVTYGLTLNSKTSC